MTSEYKHDIPSINIVVLVTLIGVIGYIASGIYYSLLISYTGILKIEEYSYLLVLVPLAAWVIINILLKYFRPVGVSVDRVLVFLALFFASLIFYAIYKMYSDNIIQYGVLSLVFLAWSFIVLIYRPVDIKYYLAIVFLFTFLVPLPLSWLNLVSGNLSRVMGYLVACISGGEYLTIGDRVLVYITDSMNLERVFEIGYTWSGVISFTSVLAISPLIIYRVIRSNASTSRKIIGLALSVLVASAVTLLGNFLILLALLLATKYYSYDAAMSIFRQTPFLIYVVLAVLSAIYVLNRVLGGAQVGKKNGGEGFIRIREGGFTALLAFGLVFMVLMAYGFVWFAGSLGSEIIVGQLAFVQSMDAIFANPSIIVSNNTLVGNVSSLPLPSLATASGASVVNEIVIEYNSRLFPGYIEVAETPSKFHGWYVYLSSQGYRILKSWSIVDNVTINYMLLEKNKQVMLLGYTIYRVLVLTGNSTSIAYVRVSLFSPVAMKNYGEIMLAMKEIFESATKYAGATGYEDSFMLFERIILVENILILASMALVVLVLSKNYLPLIIRRLKSVRQ